MSRKRDGSQGDTRGSRITWRIRLQFVAADQVGEPTPGRITGSRISLRLWKMLMPEEI